MAENFLPYATAGLMILVALLIFALWRMKRALLGQMADFERYRRRQQADLAERVERSDERAARDLQMIHEMLEGSARNNEARMERLVQRVDEAAQRQRQESEQLRDTVDKRLRETLEKRLGESFRQVSEQLERVYKGLGEMQNLAQGVGDLKRVLTGVKTRGIWGEARLKALLEQNLAPGQYLENTAVEPGGTERVEYAICLPGKEEGTPVLLPVDAKFPQEDYQRLLEAADAGDKAGVDKAGAMLEKSLFEQARRISTKYIRVPHTTDFAVMFLPVEGLYAEALRRPGIAEKMQEKYRVLLSGPTTLSALLTSLQMGFRSVAVEARSEEIWRLLGSVREEFLRFGEQLDRTRQRIEQAGAELDTAASRTARINRQLRRVDDLSVPAGWKEEAEDSASKS